MGFSFRPILMSSTSICFALISTAAYAAPTDYDGKWLVFLQCGASVSHSPEFQTHFNIVIANGQFTTRNSEWKGRIQDKIVTVEAEHYDRSENRRDRYTFSGKPTAPYQMELSGIYWTWIGGYTGGSQPTRTCTLTLNLLKGAPLSLAVQEQHNSSVTMTADHLSELKDHQLAKESSSRERAVNEVQTRVAAEQAERKRELDKREKELTERERKLKEEEKELHPAIAAQTSRLPKKESGPSSIAKVSGSTRNICDTNVDIATRAAPAGTPNNVLAFLGHWGPGEWGTSKRCNALIVHSVTIDGTARVTYVYGTAFFDRSGINTTPGSFDAIGTINGNSLRFTSQMGRPVEYKLKSDGRLEGWYGQSADTVFLAKSAD